LVDCDYLKIEGDLEVMAHGTTQSGKAKESEDQPETARILQQNRII